MAKTRRTKNSLLTLADTAKALGVGRGVVQAWIEGGELAFVDLSTLSGKVQRRRLRVRRRDLDEFIDGRTVVKA